VRSRLVGLWWVVFGTAMTVGVPMFLWALPTAVHRPAGWPLPHHAPAASAVAHTLGTRLPADAPGIILFCAAWIVWAWLWAVPLVLDVGSRIARVSTPELPLGFGQGWAWSVVTGAMLLVAPVGGRGTTTSPQPRHAAVAQAAPAITLVSTSVDAAQVATQASDRPIGGALTYEVRRGDSVWLAAKARLLSLLGRKPTNAETASYTRRIIQATPTLAPPRNPDVIFPGEHLIEPAFGDQSGVAPGTPGASEPVDGTPGVGVAPVATPIDGGPATTAQVASPTTVDHNAPVLVPSEARGTRPATVEARRPVDLPSGSSVPLSAAAGFLAHMAIARLHRRRRHRPGCPNPGIALAPHPPAEPMRSLIRAGARADSPDLPDADPSERLAAASGGQSDEAAVSASRLDDGSSFRVLGDDSGDVVRALMVDSLLRHPPPDGHSLWLEAAHADGLFGGATAPNMRRFDSEATLLEELEIERTRRTRLLAEADAADLDEFRECPAAGEAIDTLLVVATASDSTARRWSALIGGCERLGMRVVLIAGPDLGVATRDVGASADTDIPRLKLEDGSALLEQIAAVRSGGSDTDDPQPAEEAEFPFDVIEAGHRRSADDRVRVTMFGRVSASMGGREVEAGVRESARELLAYLAYNPAGERREAIIDALWQEHDATRAHNAWRNAVPSLRNWIRELVGRPAEVVVSSGAAHYRLEAELFDVDLWEFQALLRDAVDAEPSSRASLRREALSLYTGDFAPGVSSEWAEWARDKLRQKAVDTAVSIAEYEEHEAGDLEAALAAVERAAEIDPLVEDLCVRGVRLLVQLGRLDSARRLYSKLQSTLDTELGVDPAPATREQVGQLLSDAERRRAAIQTRGERDRPDKSESVRPR
jgi:DNA-binding SARP family transcriptional activator